MKYYSNLQTIFLLYIFLNIYAGYTLFFSQPCKTELINLTGHKVFLKKKILDLPGTHGKF